MMKELQSKKKKIVVEGLKKAYKAKDGKFSLEAIENCSLWRRGCKNLLTPACRKNQLGTRRMKRFVCTPRTVGS